MTPLKAINKNRKFDTETFDTDGQAFLVKDHEVTELRSYTSPWEILSIRKTSQREVFYYLPTCFVKSRGCCGTIAHSDSQRDRRPQSR